MQLCLVLLAFIGLSVAAPQAAWPYPDSLLPYRYGYPGQGQYKYLPELEDDEEVGPYLSSHKTGRQDLVVGEGAKPVVPTEVPGVTVVETGSVAPVKENEPGKVHAEAPAPPPKVTPVAASKPAEKPVQPPPFPPARPPPTEAPKEEKEEDEEDDDDSEEDDVENVDDEHLHEQEVEQDDEHDQEDDSEQDDDTEDDEEEEVDDDPEEDDDDDDRRRQAPLHDEVPSSVAPVVVPAPAAVEAASAKPVVVEPKEPEVVENEVVVVKKTVVPPAPVVDTDDESSEEVAVPPVEALVPGYITEQGEVLVPVDTVIGDQPISIVDDPSTPPARGVPFRAPAYDGYRSPYYYPSLYRPDSQDESDELDDSSQNDDAEDDVPASGSAARNGFLTSFPPSRTPELYALIESRIPVDSNVDFEDYQVYGGGKPAAAPKPYPQQRPFYNGPYSQPRPYGPYPQQQYSRPQFAPQYDRPPYMQQFSRPPYVQQRPQQYSRPPYAQQPYTRRPGQSQSFTVALAMSGNGAGYGPQPVPIRMQNQNQVVPIPVRSNVGYSGYNRYQGPYQPSPFYAPYNQNPFNRKPVYEPVYGGYVQPQYGPFRVGGYSPRPQVASQQQEEFPGTASGGFRPQINNRIVIHGSGGQQSVRPVPVPVKQYSRPYVGYRRPVHSQVHKPGQVVKVPNPQKENKVKTSHKRRPTPVIKQADDEVYSYEPLVSEDSVDSSADVADSYEHETRRAPLVTSVSKSRRIPKMAKKSKVNKKKVSANNSDPLNILKKSNSKSRRN